MKKTALVDLAFRYRAWDDLKKAIRQSGYSRVQIAVEMGLTPSNLSQKLSGYSALSEEEEKKIIRLTQKGG